MAGSSLIEHFAAFQDPRQFWKVLFPLPEILLLVLCATLAGAEDFVEIRRWGQMHQDFLRRLLPFAAGIPSHDTLNDVRNAVDGALFAQCFTAWVETLRDPAARVHSRFETTDGDHGRAEVRRHRVSHDVDWLTTARRFPGEPRFPGLRSIAVVEAAVERNASTSLERRCSLSFLPLDAKLFAHAVRCHWHVENRLHWVLDVVSHEDLSRLRSGAGPQNMATVRHMAMNLLRGPKDKHSLKVRRKSAAWDTDYLEALLRQSA